MQIPPHIRQFNDDQLIDHICHRPQTTPTPMEVYLATIVQERGDRDLEIDELENKIEEWESDYQDVSNNLHVAEETIETLENEIQSLKLAVKCIKSATPP